MTNLGRLPRGTRSRWRPWSRRSIGLVRRTPIYPRRSGSAYFNRCETGRDRLEPNAMLPFRRAKSLRKHRFGQLNFNHPIVRMFRDPGFHAGLITAVLHARPHQCVSSSRIRRTASSSDSESGTAPASGVVTSPPPILPGNASSAFLRASSASERLFSRLA